jgi:putative NADH-flavin reductase
MKIALVGASGNAGSRIQRELVSRGHAVIAIARNADRIEAQDGVTPVPADAGDADALAAAIQGSDAVVTSLKFAESNPETLIAAVRQAGVPRYLIVGGAASLKATGTDQRIIDSGTIPEAWMPEVGGGVKFLDRLKQEPEGLDWVFLSPSMFFGPGERTGTFRLGKDELLTAPDGKSSISYEDFAVALVDEIETPRHHRERFTVGY